MTDSHTTEEIGDEPPELDLTPRDAKPARRPGRRWAAMGVVVVVVAAIGFVLFKGLGDASLFFRNVDEAVDQREELGDKRFTMQGSPVSGSISETTTADGQAAVAFTILYDGVTAEVVHVGSPPDLFQPEVPVIIDGRWVGDTDDYYFASDRMRVKHDNEYRVDNEERIEEAERRGQG